MAAIGFGQLQQGPRTPRVLRAGGAWQERAGGQARPQALGCWVSARESDSGRGARPLSYRRPGPVAASRDLSTTTSQLRFLPARAGEDRTLPGGRRDVASALSDGDADKLRLGMLL